MDWWTGSAAALAVFVVLASSGGARAAPSRVGDDRILVPGFERAAERAAERLDHQRIEEQVPGMSAAVWCGDSVVWARGFGLADVQHSVPVDARTRFRLGSVSKVFAASLAAKLAAEGVVDLDAPVDEYVEQCPLTEPPITLRQLLGHLGGIRHYLATDYAPDRPGGNIDVQEYASTVEALRIFVDDELVAPPGEQFSYSTFGFTLVTAVLESATDQSFEELLAEHVFAPLQLETVGLDRPRTIVAHRTSFYELEDGRLAHASYLNPAYKWAGGGMIATAGDVARFGAAHFAPGFLEEPMFEEVFTRQQTDGGEEISTGLGWRIARDACGRTTYLHSGSQNGCRAMLAVWPQEQISVVLMSNLSGTPRAIDRWAQQVGDDFHLMAPGADGSAWQDQVRTELIARLELDQAVRQEAMSAAGGVSGNTISKDLAQRWDEVDRSNTAYLSRVLERHGWPGYDMVGEEAAHAAFFLAQHADRDPEFQARCLKALQQAVEAEQASRTDLAYLIDRVAVARGEPQTYGTQVNWVDGEPTPFELIDPDQVDERRATVGLGPIQEYLDSMGGG